MGTETLEKRKQFLFFGILIVGFIGLVVASPTIYAIVEPHITINMDPGQTTKPFQINDDAGKEIFSINPDSTFSSANYVDIVFKQVSEVHVDAGAGDTSTNPVILAKWKFTKAPGVTDSFKPVSFMSLTVTGLKSSGTHNVHCGLVLSDDGITWRNTFFSTFFSTSEFTNRIESASAFGISQDVMFFGLGCWGAEVDEVGVMKEFTFYGRTYLPLGYSMERIM